jgi:hypothetical protein
MSNLFDKICGFAKLWQNDLANSVIPAHHFVGDALEPSAMLSVQVLLRAIQNMCDPELVDAPLVAQGLNGRNVKFVCDLVYGIAHWIFARFKGMARLFLK